MKLENSYILLILFGCSAGNATVLVAAEGDIPRGVISQRSILDERVSCVLVNDNLGFCDRSRCDFLIKASLGVEFAFSYNEVRHKRTPLFSVSISSKTKKEVLDEIIKKNPGYIWNETNGVINIRPYEVDKTSNSASVLDKTIPGFAAHGIPLKLALQKLVEIAAKTGIPITTAERILAAHMGVNLSTAEERIKRFKKLTDEPLLNISLKQTVSIRDCLNAMVSAIPDSQWYSFRQKGGTMLVVGTDKQYYSQLSREPGTGDEGPDLFEGFFDKPKTKN